MNIHTLKIPAYFELEPSLAFAQEALAISAEATIVSLDFSSWARVKGYELPLKPFGMLIVSQAVRQLRKRLPNAVIVPIELPNNDIESYAAHMGFFDACGIELTKPFGNAKGGRTYLPLSSQHVESMKHGSLAEPLGLELAQKLVQQSDGALVKTLAYSFMEMIRNVIEHSQSPDFWYCAQYWDSKGEAEIAIMDCGIGLRKSLEANPHVLPLLTSPREVLKYALWPGISGKMYAGKASNPSDPWENSGYGLYMNYRICNEGGNFFIASDGKGLYREDGQETSDYDYGLPGVALRLRMKVKALEDFENHRQRFLMEAESEATKVRGGILPTGAKMSQMLRHNFRFENLLITGTRVTHPTLGSGLILDTRTSKQGTNILKIKFDNGREKELRQDEVGLEG